MRTDEGRDHDCALASGYNTAVHVIAERLRVAEACFLIHLMPDVNRGELICEEKFGVSYSIVSTAVHHNTALDAEKAGFELLGGEADGVHLYVTEHGL